MAESCAVASRLSDWAAVDAAWRRSLARGVCDITKLVSRSECIVLRERPQCGVSLCAPCGLWLILRKNLRDLLNCIPITVCGWNPQKLLNLSEVTDRLHLPSIKAQNESVLNRDDLEQPVVC